MKEVYDDRTGAILFKNDEGNPVDKRLTVLEENYNKLYANYIRLLNEVEILKQLLNKE